MPNKCCCSVAKSCPTLCDPMDCSRPGFPVLHHLLEFVQLVNVSESKLLYTSVKDRCGTRGRNSEFLWLFRNESVNVTKHITKKDVEGKPKRRVLRHSLSQVMPRHLDKMKLQKVHGECIITVLGQSLPLLSYHRYSPVTGNIYAISPNKQQA